MCRRAGQAIWAVPSPCRSGAVTLEARCQTVGVDRAFFSRHALEVAPELLGVRLTVYGGEHDDEDRAVTLRITEVEAYHGVGVPGPHDAGSHSRHRKTDRNASMFGPPGHAYVYFSYGMHFALNLVCSPEDQASGVLVRAGEIIGGAEIAQARREAGRSSKPIAARQLARGPGNVASALGITRSTHDGLDLLRRPFEVQPPDRPVQKIASGQRVGVSGEAGGPAFPWRFWIEGDPTVSAYRPGRNVPQG